jgi:hypothetical protein
MPDNAKDVPTSPIQNINFNLDVQTAIFILPHLLSKINTLAKAGVSNSN